MTKVESKPDPSEVREEQPIENQEVESASELTSEVAHAAFQSGFYAPPKGRLPSADYPRLAAAAGLPQPNLDHALGSQVFKWRIVVERPVARSASSEQQRSERLLKEVREEWMKGYTSAGRREILRSAERIKSSK